MIYAGLIYMPYVGDWNSSLSSWVIVNRTLQSRSTLLEGAHQMLLDHRPVLSLEETGSNIKKLRMEKGISVKELQGLLGFDNPQAIYNWERGRNMPSIDNLLVLSEIFGVSINEIVGKNFLNGFPA